MFCPFCREANIACCKDILKEQNKIDVQSSWKIIAGSRNLLDL